MSSEEAIHDPETPPTKHKRHRYVTSLHADAVIINLSDGTVIKAKIPRSNKSRTTVEVIGLKAKVKGIPDKAKEGNKNAR